MSGRSEQRSDSVREDEQDLSRKEIHAWYQELWEAIGLRLPGPSNAPRLPGCRPAFPRSARKHFTEENPMTRVLQVLTSNDQLGDTSRKTGYWTSEFTHAHREFEKAGYHIDLASVKGGTPPVDPLSDPHSEVSSNRNDQISIDFYSDPDVMAQLAHTSRLSEVDPADYDVIYFVGGAGAMWDFPDDPDIIAFVRVMWERGKIVSAVCHGSAALTNVRLSDGSYLVAGRRVTGFSNKEEKYLEEQLFHLPKFVPWYLQDRLVERGGIYDEGEPYTPHVAVDGNLFTGQQPASGGLLARTIVNTLATDQK